MAGRMGLYMASQNNQTALGNAYMSMLAKLKSRESKIRPGTFTLGRRDITGIKLAALQLLLKSYKSHDALHG